MFNIFKKKQQPTCKKCGMIAVGTNIEGYCPNCAETKETYTAETVCNSGTETATTYDKNGNTVNQMSRTVTPEQTAEENCNLFRCGVCCVCWDKTVPVDDYDLCSKCKETDIKDITAIFHVAQIFSLRHKEMIDNYENAIIDAYNENDIEGALIIATEYKSDCCNMGIGGRIFIEKQINDLQRRKYDRDTVGYALRIALTGDDLQP